MQAVAQSGRKIIAGRSIRWDEALAQSAYADGYWVHDTLANSLRRAAAEDPERVLIVDGAVRLDARSLLAKAETLAQVMGAQFPQGSVISFMLPNWHEAAVIYMAATMAGMIAHPILPSLREHDLCFMLQDIESRMIFIPEQFRKHDYVAMLANVVATLENPPQVVVLRSERTAGFVAYGSLFQQVEPISLPAVDANAVRMIMYTSGTTGSPKGVKKSMLNCFIMTVNVLQDKQVTVLHLNNNFLAG